MRYSTTCAAAAPEAVTASSTKSTLQDLDLRNILSPQGLINPEVAEGSQGYVFAIYDEKQKTQYIGFSKDLRHSLRTVFSRRSVNKSFTTTSGTTCLSLNAEIRLKSWTIGLRQLVRSHPLAISQPLQKPVDAGAIMAMERDQWQKPVDAGAISQRGKQGAAEEQARQLLEMIKQKKGCKEEWIPNDALLAEGLVDFLPAKDLTPEELEIQKQAMLEQAKNLRQATAIVDGVPKNFQVLYHDKYPTNGGFMVDMTMIMDGKETEHRVIVGKGYYEPFGISPEAPIEAALALLLGYYEPFGISPEAPIEAALALLLGNKMPRHTEGIINSSTFPVNYFSVSELEQWFGDQYVGEFLRTTDCAGQQDTTPHGGNHQQCHLPGQLLLGFGPGTGGSETSMLASSSELPYKLAALGNTMPRHTEGIINCSTLAVNYFSVSELDQYVPQNHW
eukprot:gene23411-30685_t